MAQIYMPADTEITEVHAPGLATTPLFWDCECERDYIHPAAQNECPVCGAIRAEQPDSQVNEVLGECQHLLTPEQMEILNAAQASDNEVALVTEEKT